jgi:hypothetical protein
MPTFCSQCGTALAPGAKFCEECGTPIDEKQGTKVSLQTSSGPLFESSSDPETEGAIKATQPDSRGSSQFGVIVIGVIWTLLGLFIYLWASRHSPYMDFGGMLMGGLDNYIIKEPAYSVIVLIAAVLGLLGIVQLVLGLAAEVKK